MQFSRASQLLSLGRKASRQPSVMAPQSRSAFSACARAFPNEPTKPEIKTGFPSPKTIEFKEKFGAFSCNLQTHFPIDLKNSLGNYVQDADGNRLLDMFCSIGTNAVGYNHPQMVNAASDDLMQMVVGTRTGLGINPIKEQASVNKDAYMDIAPPNMDRVTLSMCGTCANEGAFKLAMLNYAQRKRGGPVELPTEEELSSCMSNQSPGSPDYAILSLKSGFHGRLFGTLSATRTNPVHKVDIPAFNWPAAQSPVYKFPLAENEEYNREQDRLSLVDVRAKIEQWKAEKGSEVVAVILEPVQSEGGDNILSPEFARGLRTLTKELGIYMIVDEVQTGVCATGKFWAHEHWNLDSPPDFVTFAKKMLSCGFYHNNDTQVMQPYRHFNTFFGDPVRAQLTAAQNKILKADKLHEVAAATGQHLMNNLQELEKKHPRFIQNTRGLGTYMAFSVESPAARDALCAGLKKYGVNQGGCGSSSIRFRPTLYLEQKHADLYLDALDRTCQDLSQ